MMEPPPPPPKGDPPKPKYQSPGAAHGHAHGEAFCLMWYQCRACGALERIWNSRDGVTPFGMECASCGGHAGMHHVRWELDEYAPNHKLRHGQRFWRDGTLAEAEAIMRRRIESTKGTEYECTPETKARLLEHVRSGECSEFQQGWPMIDVHDSLAVRQ